MVREILHLHIPDFPIAVARVADSSLCTRPVAVAPGNSERALLQAVSAEARSEGVREGMPVWRARRLCPPLHLLPPDPALTARAEGAVREIVAEYTPIWEPASPGDLYLDLTGSAGCSDRGAMPPPASTARWAAACVCAGRWGWPATNWSRASPPAT